MKTVLPAGLLERMNFCRKCTDGLIKNPRRPVKGKDKTQPSWMIAGCAFPVVNEHAALLNNTGFNVQGYILTFCNRFNIGQLPEVLGTGFDMLPATHPSRINFNIAEKDHRRD